MSESPVDNTEPFLSFANPNYQFEDRLNSNIGNSLSGTTGGPGSNLISLEHTTGGSLKDHLISGDLPDRNSTSTTNGTTGTSPSSYINEEDLDLDIHHLSFSSSPSRFNLDEEKENIGLCADDRRNYERSIHLDRVDPLQQHYNTLPLAIKQRKRYAQLDLTSMGIDLSPSDGHNPLAAGHELGLLMSPCDGTEDAISDDDDTSGTYEQLEKDPLLVYKDDDDEEEEEEDDDDDDDDDDDEEDEEGMGVYELDEEDDEEIEGSFPEQDDYDDEEDEEEDNRLNEDERRRKNIKENLSMCMQQVGIVSMSNGGIGCNRDLNSLSDEKPRSFLEYYSLLEAKARECQERDDINEADQLHCTDVNIIHKNDTCDSQDEEDDDDDDDVDEVEEIDDDDDEDEEYENVKVISFEKSNNLKNEQYINSPDSHDSGIQSDTRLDENILNIPSEITRIPSSEKNGYEKFNNEKLGLDDCNDIDDGVHAVDDDVDEVDNIDDDEDEEEDDIDDDYDDQNSVEENNSETLTDDKFDSEENTPVEQLPQGWERHEDDDGPYYWHIQSGTIQRSPPPPPSPGQLETKRSNSSDSSQASAPSSVPSSPNSTSSNTEEHLQAFENHVLKYAAKSLQSLCSSTEKSPVPVRRFSKHEPVRFAVRSFGWVCIADEDLSPAKSSKAVNKCILDLSLGRNDLNDVVGRWGDGKDLYMDLDDHSLRLVSPVDETILNIQPIHTIRVWGVGRDNGRDFAYVSRDKTTRKHMCHVFRCDTPAREIANTLRDICKRIMLEQGLQQNANMNRLNRPTDLPNLEGGKENGQPNGQKLTFQNLYNNTSFPTPMEEPKKVIRCHYLGFKEVFKPSGMDTLNNAIDSLYTKVPPEMWVFVNVAIAPSTITISEHSNPEKKIDECRVRFLSFMGIAMSNIKLCAFIMHTAEDQYFAHVFHCEPSAGPLCKTIEAACKLRYQKCLDAHPQTPTSQNSQNKSLGASIRKGVKSIVSSISHKYRPPK